MSTERSFDETLKAHGLCRADVVAGIDELWGRWKLVLQDRLAGKTYADIKKKRNGYFWNTQEVEAHALYLLTRFRFDGPNPIIPGEVDCIIKATRCRENARKTAWLDALTLYCEVTEEPWPAQPTP